MKKVRCVVGFGFVLLFGCAGTDFKSFDPKAEPVKTIALLTVPNPSAYQIQDWGGKASLFGAIGGAVVQLDARAMGEKFGAAVKSANFDFGREMQQAVSERLRRAGFNVVQVSAAREAPEKLISDYSRLPTAGADAFLDIDARIVGYSSYNIQDPEFRPHILVDARLVSTRSKAVLYSEQIMFGYRNPYMSATQLSSEKSYYFKYFGALMAKPDQALEGLRSGTRAIAGQLVARLKP